MHRLLFVTFFLLASITCPFVVAAPQKPEPLTDVGRKLEKGYAGLLGDIKRELHRSIPKPDAKKKSAFTTARQNELNAVAALTVSQKQLAEINTAKALVAHAKGKWIGGANKGIAAAKEKLKTATTEDARNAAQQELIKWQKNLQDGEQALKERQAKYTQAEKKRPQIMLQITQAQQALTDAKAATQIALDNLGLQKTLSSSQYDALLAKHALISEASPAGLAAFAQQSKYHQMLIHQMLSSDPLMIQMMLADGASGGHYGEAIKIYSEIQQASNKASSRTLQKLALAISLEHAAPIKQRNAVSLTKSPTVVDPVKRYLHYEKAFLNGELDPCFNQLTPWDMRMVVNGEEPDEILAWGREMLRNYRPDHIRMEDYRWRYVATVRSDIRYGSQDNKYDKPELQFFQNILMNGGVCGRRAFFGRFILRAFGVPTTARPQRGHAALAHWTPQGWVVCLGGGWGAGWTKTRYNKDLDFLATTQARATGESFKIIKRAQWIGDLFDEPKVYGFLTGSPRFWYATSLHLQRNLIHEAKTKTLSAVGEDIGEANETKEKIEIAKVTLSDKDRRISVSPDGAITIPAVATSQPTRSNGKIILMKGYKEGSQLHYSRNGPQQTFEYVVNIPQAADYRLTALVVTPSWKQSMQLSLNGGSEKLTIPLPFTVGKWENTTPLTISLQTGENKLTFSRNHPGLKGMTVKHFVLTPAKNRSVDQ